MVRQLRIRPPGESFLHRFTVRFDRSGRCPHPLVPDWERLSVDGSGGRSSRLDFVEVSTMPGHEMGSECPFLDLRRFSVPSMHRPEGHLEPRHDPPQGTRPRTIDDSSVDGVASDHLLSIIDEASLPFQVSSWHPRRSPGWVRCSPHLGPESQTRTTHDHTALRERAAWSVAVAAEDSGTGSTRRRA